MEDTTQILAIDVAQAELVAFNGEEFALPNQKKNIRSMLKRHPGWTLVCEPTSSYHLELITMAHEEGLRVCLVNPKEMNNYRECRSFRAKTDRIDAKAIHEFARRHREVLRTWQPIPEDLTLLRKLIGKRKAAVDARTRFTQAYGKEDEQCAPVQKALTDLIDDLAIQIATIAGRYEDYERMLSLSGVGPCSAAALTFVLNAHDFFDDDAAVAFLGIDLRVRNSGRFKGQRKLSKRGDPVLRYYITLAGFGLLNCRMARDARAKLNMRNRKWNEQGVIAARKVVRTAFALHKTKTTFDPEKWTWMT